MNTLNQEDKVMCETPLLAHSKNASGQNHLLIEHLYKVSDLAKSYAEPFLGKNIAGLLGLLHDAGKVQAGFQDYLQGKTSRGPYHAWVGAVLAEKWKFGLGPLGLALSGHHAGLQEPQAIRTYLRDQRKIEVFQEIEPSLKKLFASLDPIQQVDWPSYISSDLKTPDERRRFELFVRFLFSCLVDADFLDTERHFHSDTWAKRQTTFLSIHEMWQLLQDAQKEFDGRTGDLNQYRKEIYDACVSSAVLDPGFFRLTVPTGGGKTRSGLAFALKHAKEHNLKRVIVAIPYTSIIEQTVDVYRGIFGPKNVLEHHSAIPVREDQEKEDDPLRLAAQNWDATLIVTTTVQLFESLFANRPSRCRKLHNIASSVIVLDEIQTLPVEVLEPTLDVLSELVQHYGVSVVFCTATQPAFEEGTDFLERLKDIREIVPKPKHYFQKLKRVTYDRIETPLAWEELAGRVKQCGNQCLCILNSKKNALQFTKVLLNTGIIEDHVFHLSTNLCGAHRRKVLLEVRKRLDNKRKPPCLLVSTQVVEAGVDLDFPVVFRAVGPLDRIIQAAGRCNRENKLPNDGVVYIFEPEEESLPVGVYRTASDYARQFFQSAHDLHNPDTFKDYFKGLFKMVELDAGDVQTYRKKIDFPETAVRYRLIRDDSCPIVVSYSEAKEKIVDLTNRIQNGWGSPSDLWRELQPFLVNIPHYELEKAKREHWSVPITERLWHWSGRYDKLMGLMFEPPDPEDIIV